MEVIEAMKRRWVPGITASGDEGVLIENSIENALLAARTAGFENTAIALERMLSQQRLLSRRTSRK